MSPVREPFIDEIAKVQSHSVTHATSFVQAAAVQALSGPQEFIGEMVQHGTGVATW